MPNTFVFIAEEQQGGYSKSTLSSINAQVAKYAHEQRRVITKSKSAPSSPSSLGSTDGSQKDSTQQTQDDQRHKQARSTSAPALVKPGSTVKHGLKDGKCSIRRDGGERFQRKSMSQRKGLKDIALDENAKQKDTNDEPAPEKIEENIEELFQQLCHITKSPVYQPFPFYLNLEEQRLVHFWFTSVLGDDFGMKLQLDTFQGPLVRYNMAFQVPLQWAIAKAAHQLSVKAGQSTAVAYRSKEKALQRLQNIISDPNTTTDEAVGSVLQSIVHQVEFRKIHLKGMDAMIAARGGLEEVVRTSEVTCSDHIFLMYTFAPYEILEFDELETLKQRLFNTLRRMQDQFHDFTRTTSLVDTWAATADLADLNVIDGHMAKWSYSQLRMRIFSSDTCIGRLVRQEYKRDIGKEADFQYKTRPFAALFQLAAMLLEFDSVVHRELFLRRLDQAAEKTCTLCDVTGKPKILPGTFVFMAGHVCRQVQLELGFGERDEIGLGVALNGIAMLKIFGLLLESMRLRLYTYLQYWLLRLPPSASDPSSPFGSPSENSLRPSDLTDEDMSAMSSVITQLWMQRVRRNSTPAESMDYFSV